MCSLFFIKSSGAHRDLHSFPTRRSSDLQHADEVLARRESAFGDVASEVIEHGRAHVLGDRKSTRLNSSHVRISYAVFCLKKKKNIPSLKDWVASLNVALLCPAEAIIHNA